MNDIQEFIELRRKSFKNPCFQIEPLYDWIKWSCSNGTLYSTKTSESIFDGISITWRIKTGNYEEATLNTFINEYDKIDENYDIFVLDFFAENQKSRNKLINEIIYNNPKLNNIWAFRKGKLVKISNNYLYKLYKIQWEAHQP